MLNEKTLYINHLQDSLNKETNGAKKVSPSLKSFFRRLSDFEEEYGKEVEEFDNNDILALLHFLAKKSPNSLAAYFSMLKKYYQYLHVHRDIRTECSLKYSDFKDLVTKDVYYSRIIPKDELYSNLHRIVNACERLLLRLIFAGIKGEGNWELINLKKSDIDLRNQVIHVKGRTVKMDATIEREVRMTMAMDAYYMSNGEGEIRKITVNLIESDYLFRPIEEKMALKRDRATLKQLTPQSIQRRVLKLLQQILNRPNMTLQTLYTSGILNSLVEYSIKHNTVLSNLEVREWLEERNYSTTKQEIFVMYKEMLTRVQANNQTTLNI